GVRHLRLILGTSMGCMHAWMWGEAHPTFMDGLMPLACLPVAIAGRNRAWRKAILDGIRADPAWRGGEDKEEPVGGLRLAATLLAVAGSSPVAWQEKYPTREAADAFVEQGIAARAKGMDANDLLYQVDASRTYDPSARLGEIQAKVMYVNFADDF